jgi:hypothetical protein
VLGFALGIGLGFAVIELAQQVDDDDRPPVADEPVRIVGAPDFIAWCRTQNVDRADATVITSDAWGWRCVGIRNGMFGYDEIVTDEVCRDQFGADAIAQLVNAESPTGWQCVVPT